MTIVEFAEMLNTITPEMVAAQKPLLCFWPMLALAAGGALLGAKRHERERQIEDADRKLAAEQARTSYITGRTPQQIRRAGSALGSIGQGAVSGAMFGQQFGGAATPQGDGLGTGSWWDQLKEANKPKPSGPDYSGFSGGWGSLGR